ncbi:MAG: hypothetical protein HYZ34_13985 [Ignavibacteriae bacterium]|nr:hypothetical protein [Ignavibacteriota bacterium]
MILFQIVVFLLLVIPTGITAQENSSLDNLPKKLNTAIDKILDDQFADIEQALIQSEQLEPKEVLLITIPLENYIEDVLFTINRPATIYPQTLYRVLKDLYKQGKSRAEIEQSLVAMQKENQFKKLYEAALQ